MRHVQLLKAGGGAKILVTQGTETEVLEQTNDIWRSQRNVLRKKPTPESEFKKQDKSVNKWTRRESKLQAERGGVGMYNNTKA